MFYSTLRIWAKSLSILSLTVGAVVSMESVLTAQSFLIGGFADGIYASQLKSDGTMTPAIRVVEHRFPAFFVIHPKLDVVYAVKETMRNDAKDPASVVAYRFDAKALESMKSPTLTSIGSAPINGDIPCHVSVDKTGKFIVVSNYVSGSIAVYPLDAKGGIEKECCFIQHSGNGPNKQRQEGPHAHCSQFDASNKWVLTADLGIDKVMIYAFDASTGQLRPGPQTHLTMAPGSGPRHIAFHPNNRLVFIINELNTTLTSASWNAETGELKEIQTLSTLPPNPKSTDGYSTAEVLVHPSGKFVYGSNRGHDTIVAYKLNEESGQLTYINNFTTGGRVPRNFRMTPNGEFLLAENQETGNIVSFRIDPVSGKLSPTGFSINQPSPACVKFLGDRG